jgi:hypothetical protein
MHPACGIACNEGAFIRGEGTRRDRSVGRKGGEAFPACEVPELEGVVPGAGECPPLRRHRQGIHPSHVALEGTQQGAPGRSERPPQRPEPRAALAAGGSTEQFLYPGLPAVAQPPVKLACQLRRVPLEDVGGEPQRVAHPPRCVVARVAAIIGDERVEVSDAELGLQPGKGEAQGAQLLMPASLPQVVGQVPPETGLILR